jgi:phage shock protein A
MVSTVLSAVKVADQIQKEITAKRSELDNLRSKVRRLEEKVETLTKVRAVTLIWPTSKRNKQKTVYEINRPS